MSCPFCTIPDDRIIHTGTLVVALWDAYPLSPGHALIVPVRHVGSWFDATPDERIEMLSTADVVRDLLERDHEPDGFNLGINDGVAAGQAIMHLHLHLIPRYADDPRDPGRGIRWMLPHKAAWR